VLLVGLREHQVFVGHLVLSLTPAAAARPAAPPSLASLVALQHFDGHFELDAAFAEVCIVLVSSQC
jgi:hypothetical protein